MKASDFIDKTVSANDGEIGKLRDLFFDHDTWTIRYLVVETGGWLSRHQVLLPTASAAWHTEQDSLTVDASKDGVEKSPDISLQKPVSREAELLLGKYWQWTPYWTEAPLTDEMAANIDSEATSNTKAQMQDLVQSHLRSVAELTGYKLAAVDKTFGKVEDFEVDAATWRIEAIIVDRHPLLPGGRARVERDHIDSVDWARESIAIDLLSEEVKKVNSP